MHIAVWAAGLLLGTTPAFASVVSAPAPLLGLGLPGAGTVGTIFLAYRFFSRK
jgi:hypothetical protein